MPKLTSFLRSLTLIATVASSSTHAEVFEVINPDTSVIGNLVTVESRYEDTLSDLARTHHLGYHEITQANPGIDPWLPGEGKQIIIPGQHILPDTKRNGVVLNLAEMRLYYYPKQRAGQSPVIHTFPISIGREGWETPLGATKIVSKVKDPNWYPPQSIREEHAAAGDPLPKVVPAGPDNPLGQHALRLGIPGYLIHGTNKPYGVGMQVSHGCIRLYPEDIASLFGEIPVGTPVQIVNQPIKIGWNGNQLIMEVHQLPHNRAGNEITLENALQQLDQQLAGNENIEINLGRIESLIAASSGIPAPVGVRH